MFEDRKMKKARKKLAVAISKLLKQGRTREEIMQKAIEKGWAVEILDQIFNELEPKKPAVQIPTEKKSLVKQVEELNEKINFLTGESKESAKLKKKKFKMPYTVRSQLKKLAESSKVLVILLRNNRNISPTIGEIRLGVLVIGGNMMHNGSANVIWLWNGKFPCAVVPEWDLMPLTPEGIKDMERKASLSPEALKNDTIIKGTSAEAQKAIIRMIENKESLMKKGMNIKTLILIIVIVVIGLALLFGGGKLFG